MLVDLLLGINTTLLCLLLQSALVVAALKYFARLEYNIRSTFLWAQAVLTGLLLILLLASLMQISVWALLFHALGEFKSFEQAFYHSAGNFATLGYGDLMLSERHQLLGPLNAINGVLMMGISIAALSRGFTIAFGRRELPAHPLDKPLRSTKRTHK